jgi:hypothetical protein
MMQSRSARIALALGALAIAIVLFVVLSSDDDNSGSTQTQTQKAAGTGAAGRSGVTGSTGASGVTTPPEGESPAVITVRGAKPVGGVKRLEYTKGDTIRFEVRSDVADEIHVHGYDLMKDVKAGGTVRFNFEAKLEGVFEVELESRSEQIAELRVKPS